MDNNELKRVYEHSKEGNYSAGVMKKTTAYCGEIFRRYMKRGSVLELGSAEGVATDVLYPYFNDYTIVDGADFFVESLKQRYPKIKAYCSLFEDYSPDIKYDNIVLGHVLEHVKDPVDILKKCSKWLNQEGKILCAVPNANSIHRQAAVSMGILDSIYQLNETDIKNGHRRVYDLQSFRSDFEKAGLKIVASGGYWLKPVSNRQINEGWTDDMVDAFLKLGEKYSEIAAEIYVVSTN